MAQIRVNPGDSLWKIAKANPVPGISVTERIRQIAAASGVSDPSKIKPGQMLTVPGGKADAVPTPTMRPQPRAPIPGQGRGPDMRGAGRPAPTARGPGREMPAAAPRPKPTFDALAGEMTNRFGTAQVSPPVADYATNAAPVGAGMQTPPIGNENYADPMAQELMAGGPDFSAADPASTAGQVAGLPPDMNTAAFPDSGAQTPVADAMNQSQVLASMDPAQRQALIQALMAQGPGM